MNLLLSLAIYSDDQSMPGLNLKSLMHYSKSYQALLLFDLELTNTESL